MNYSTGEIIQVIGGALGGIILTVLTQRVLGKRGLLTYFVRHNRIGLSADDALFGTCPEFCV